MVSFMVFFLATLGVLAVTKTNHQDASFVRTGTNIIDPDSYLFRSHTLQLT